MPAIEMPFPFPGSSYTFDPVFSQLLSPASGGFIQTINRQTPLWTAKYTTPPLSDDRYEAVQGFFDQLYGAMFTFLGYDLRRPMPQAYKFLPAGSPPWQSGSTIPTIGNTDP